MTMIVTGEELYKIKMPFGLLKKYQPDVAKALIESGGPWESYRHDGWKTSHSITPLEALTYRLKRPEPPMTTDEFLTLVVKSVEFETSITNTRLALLAWHEGRYDHALGWIGYRK